MNFNNDNKSEDMESAYAIQDRLPQGSGSRAHMDVLTRVLNRICRLHVRGH